MKLEIDNSCNKINFVSDNLYYHVLTDKQKSKINIKRWSDAIIIFQR
jgi:hypothetical protein